MIFLAGIALAAFAIALTSGPTTSVHSTHANGTHSYGLDVELSVSQSVGTRCNMNLETKSFDITLGSTTKTDSGSSHDLFYGLRLSIETDYFIPHLNIVSDDSETSPWSDQTYSPVIPLNFSSSLFPTEKVETIPGIMQTELSHSATRNSDGSFTTTTHRSTKVNGIAIAGAAIAAYAIGATVGAPLTATAGVCAVAVAISTMSFGFCSPLDVHAPAKKIGTAELVSLHQECKKLKEEHLLDQVEVKMMHKNDYNNCQHCSIHAHQNDVMSVRCSPKPNDEQCRYIVDDNRIFFTDHHQIIRADNGKNIELFFDKNGKVQSDESKNKLKVQRLRNGAPSCTATRTSYIKKTEKHEKTSNRKLQC